MQINTLYLSSLNSEKYIQIYNIFISLVYNLQAFVAKQVIYDLQLFDPFYIKAKLMTNLRLGLLHNSFTGGGYLKVLNVKCNMSRSKQGQSSLFKPTNL